MFDKMKALMEMQKKMQELKRQLENTDFEASSADGRVTVNMTAAQQVNSVTISGDIQAVDKAALESALRDAYNRAIKRSQEIAAQKTKEIAGLNLPGLI
jgi:DNA-binding protein YbaB